MPLLLAVAAAFDVFFFFALFAIRCYCRCHTRTFHSSIFFAARRAPLCSRLSRHNTTPDRPCACLLRQHPPYHHTFRCRLSPAMLTRRCFRHLTHRSLRATNDAPTLSIHALAMRCVPMTRGITSSPFAQHAAFLRMASARGAVHYSPCRHQQNMES